MKGDDPSTFGLEDQRSANVSYTRISLFIMTHPFGFVKSPRQGLNLRPEIYKIPALSLSYKGIMLHKEQR